jgi:hypothetical protein
VLLALIDDDDAVGDVKSYYQENGIGGVYSIEMFDDGMHNDKEADDGWYGGTIPPLGSSGTIGYFIQAADLTGNMDRSPTCRWIEVVVGSSSVSLSVNEFMASNDTTIADEAGEFDDWVEIYNYGTEDVYLGDLYLSDKINEPTQWQFPDKWIAADEYILVWCDKDEEQGELHTNFKLSASGDYIGIFDNDDNLNIVIDGLDFGPQETDQAVGRLPDGTGSYRPLSATPGSTNDITSATEELVGAGFQIHLYPNPVHEILYTEAIRMQIAPDNVMIMDGMGRVVFKAKWQEQMALNFAALPVGLYFVVVEKSGHYLMAEKVVKQ